MDVKKSGKNRFSLNIRNEKQKFIDSNEMNVDMIIAFLVFKTSFDSRNAGNIISDESNEFMIKIDRFTSIASLKMLDGEITIGYSGGYLWLGNPSIKKFSPWKKLFDILRY